jgi:hypothetical protein
MPDWEPTSGKLERSLNLWLKLFSNDPRKQKKIQKREKRLADGELIELPEVKEDEQEIE